jgi:hypothetical protein
MNENEITEPNNTSEEDDNLIIKVKDLTTSLENFIKALNSSEFNKVEEDEKPEEEKTET